MHNEVHENRVWPFGAVGTELAGLTNNWIKTGKSQELTVIGETVNVTDFPLYHIGLHITDTWNGHNDGAQSFDDLFDFCFAIIIFSIQ